MQRLGMHVDASEGFILIYFLRTCNGGGGGGGGREWPNKRA